MYNALDTVAGMPTHQTCRGASAKGYSCDGRARHADSLEADWILGLGPGSGENGGEIVAAGTPAEVSHAGNSITAPYLFARLKKRVESPRTNLQY